MHAMVDFEHSCRVQGSALQRSTRMETPPVCRYEVDHIIWFGVFRCPCQSSGLDRTLARVSLAGAERVN